MTFAAKAVKFFLELEIPDNLPEEIEIINPYESQTIKEITKSFFKKYYNDNNPRIFIFGINPGRFGAGTTGIGFTDPVALREFCRIENNLGNKRELSSQFVYDFINAFGGPDKFYSKFFISAVYPMALVKDGKNYNYYNDKTIYDSLRNDIIDLMKKQIELGAKTDYAISLGKKNAGYLKEINKELNYFEKIITLDHPRFIMQYRRKKLEEYINKYLTVLKTAI